MLVTFLEDEFCKYFSFSPCNLFYHKGELILIGREMTSDFDRWEKDPFFSAAEEVQESADRYPNFNLSRVLLYIYIYIWKEYHSKGLL